VTEDAGRLLASAVRQHQAGGGQLPSTDDEWDGLARDVVHEQRAAGLYVPGLGHNLHKHRDPRTAVLLRIAAEEDQLGPHLRLFEAIGRVHTELLGRTLPLNGAGACGAALCDLGFPAEILRGFALLARTAGLLGHIAEEMRRPVGPDIYHHVDSATDYRPPDD
jgi:citrate synthase